MIIASIVKPDFLIFVMIMAAFGWMGMTYYMRSSTYKEKAREYVLAARTIGASDSRIIFKHILPNSIAIIVMFVPFAVSSGIVSLTSLDFLGYGLPAPTRAGGGCWLKVQRILINNSCWIGCYRNGHGRWLLSLVKRLEGFDQRSTQLTNRIYQLV